MGNKRKKKLPKEDKKYFKGTDKEWQIVQNMMP